MILATLSSELTGNVLAYLGVQPGGKTIASIDRLVEAYTRTVPWESAFRMVRRAHYEKTTDCPRWPDIFWADAVQRGGGGTCFESNYAFFSLLQSLGYEGYLTINNMGDSIGCHTAIVLLLEGQKWLVDVGLPIYVALTLGDIVTEKASRYLHYTVRPDGANCYQIERAPHPKSNCFTLIDRPVDDEVYRAATVADYGEHGLFLDRVIVNKVINEQLWRFNSAELPLHLESFEDEQRIDHPITGDMAKVVGRQFGMDEGTLRMALDLTKA